MALTIQYEDSQGLPHSFWIRDHESVTVGSSVHADQQILGDPAIDKLHFYVRYEQDQWVLGAVSDQPLLLNKDYTRLSVLQDGDTIQAGSTTFLVILPQTIGDSRYGDSEDQDEPTDTVSMDGPSPQLLDWWNTRNRTETPLQADMLEYQIEGIEEHFQEFLPHFRSIGSAALVWNRKAFGNPHAHLTGWTVTAQDLFAQAPDEISEEQSLAVGSIDWNACDIPVLSTILKSDTALLLFHAADIAQLVERKRVMWGWFAKPSLLQFQLRHGSKLLAENILHPQESIAMLNHVSDALCVYGQHRHLKKISMLSHWNPID